MNAVFRLAGRELRADAKRGFGGFRVFLACLALGVAAIAAAGELSEAVKAGLRADARKLLGGDLSVSQSYRPLEGEALAFLESQGKVTAYAEMRAMARSDAGKRALVELKTVDDAYPLAGALLTEPARARPGRSKDGRHLALAEASLLTRLDIKPGEEIQLGAIRLRLQGVILSEPDKVASPFQLGPRLMISNEALAESGLRMPGSIERHVTLLSLGGENEAAANRIRAQLESRFPDSHWRIRGLDEAAPGLQRFLDNLALFLTLTGLSGLLVGGVGVANAVKSQMEAKQASIAILKSLGAGNRQLLAIYGLETLATACLGILLGLALGLGAAFLAAKLASSLLPVRPLADIYWLPLAKAGTAGLLVAAAFGIVPMTATLNAPTAQALRARIAPLPMSQRLASLAWAAPFAILLGLLVVLSSGNRTFAMWFVLAGTASLILFRLLAWLAAIWAKPQARRISSPALKLALGQLHRPASPAASVMVSLGLGLAVLTTLAQIEGNLRHQIEARVPDEAPAFFFIDIQPQQRDGFLEAARAAGGRDVRLSAMIRGRITMLDGVPAKQVRIDPSARWALDGDRGFSTSAEIPPGTDLVAGSWWDKDYRGPPLVSVDAKLAKGLGIGIGSRIGVDVLGRDIEARVVSLRDIDWSAANMNFAFLFTPATLEGAPHTLLATAKSDPASEDAIERAVTDLYPNISSIRVRNALLAVKNVLEGAGAALAVMAAVTLPAGGLVLAGAVAASQRRRIYETVVLKVLGADRATLLKAYLAEFLLLGLVTSLLAGGIGTLCSLGIVQGLMNMPWTFHPGASLALLAFGLLATLVVGHLATLSAMSAKAAPYLRNE